MTVPRDVTTLLRRFSAGDADAAGELIPLLYRELRRMAGHYLRQERRGHTLQPTALVHEAYLRLIDQRDVQWQNRKHFFGVAAQLMRRILVDYARSRHAAKRGGAMARVSLDQAIILSREATGDMLLLHDTLTRLAEIDREQARVVELRVFGGLTVEETSELLGVSPATVKRDWSMAKAWLTRELRKEPAGGR